MLNWPPCSSVHQLRGFGASSDLRCLQTAVKTRGDATVVDPVLRSVAPIKFMMSQYIFLKMVHLMFFLCSAMNKVRVYGFDGWICFYLHVRDYRMALGVGEVTSLVALT